MKSALVNFAFASRARAMTYDALGVGLPEGATGSVYPYNTAKYCQAYVGFASQNSCLLSGKLVGTGLVHFASGRVMGVPRRGGKRRVVGLSARITASVAGSKNAASWFYFWGAESEWISLLGVDKTAMDLHTTRVAAGAEWTLADAASCLVLASLVPGQAPVDLDVPDTVEGFAMLYQAQGAFPKSTGLGTSETLDTATACLSGCVELQDG